MPLCVVKAYAGICEQGYSAAQPDKPNQDAIVMEEHAPSDAVLLAVFDGHGEDGHLVAGAFRERLPGRLWAHPAFSTFVEVPDNLPPPPTPGEGGGGALAAPAPPSNSTASRPVGPPRLRRDVAGALRAALSSIEAEVLADPGIDCTMSGCTACVAVVCGADLCVANVGDSRALLARAEQVRPPPGAAAAGEGAEEGEAHTVLVPAQVTVDHKPTLPSETRRILLQGGRVQVRRATQEGAVRV